jgi:D-citramalate synthase
MNHLKHQLKNTWTFAQTITLAKEHNIATNVYLEDWSNGMRNSPEYVFSLDFLATQGWNVFTSDTLGVLIPSNTYTFVAQITAKYPTIHFDFHAHNDYDLIANVMEALKQVCMVCMLLNGMGNALENH